MKFPTIILALIFVIASCAGNGDTELTPDLPAESAHEQFFSNLFSLCGEVFVGESTYPDDPEHDLVDTELRVNIETCTPERIAVNLFRDGDTWHATWIIENREDGLHLYHDHIGDKEYEEGEEPLTGYGGYADDQGDATTQFFPADDHTAEILPEASTNVWMMSMNLEEESFIYYLERHNEPRFRAEVFRN
ncbi:MAG: hypothetical protein JJU46_13325 [Balneolaceae bacterium]|nr:hypothetical protein [Balneolaceae bacterium]MCH8548326.1 hypothetical protein [Balneolaceae bacterium]